ncbi:phage holin family protein [Cytobacillus spongiae]|jgi:hypothetical protein|uniref:phage holin family protein n=1 Tax=Cytobacillus spongiae TaxID=2901381 RepID=UPI001F26831B|nr:phage holin family protein [Cytobacillus spongiae]UII57671.1 phage holin family protein [Cytobacillus spongiae]
MNLIDFLNENYIMLVPALWVLGFALKQTPKVPDWSIIWILFLAAIILGNLAFGFSSTGIINGIIAAGVAVLGHQMFKQTIGFKLTNHKIPLYDQKELDDNRKEKAPEENEPEEHCPNEKKESS